MSIREMQRAFCNVLTDGHARAAYLADPAGYLAAYDLDSHESRALTRVDMSRLKIYARMLVSSRLDLGLKVFPTARALLPPDFMERYGPRYSREFPRTVDRESGPLAREVGWLVQFLEQLTREGELSAPGFLDALHYDAIRYRLGHEPAICRAIAAFERQALPPTDDALAEGCVLRAPGVAVKAFTYTIDPATRRVVAPAAHGAAPTLLLFHKQSASRLVRVFRINALTSRFLDACDGRHTLPGTARLVAEAERANSDECMQLGRTLAARRVVGLIANAPGAAS